MRIAMIQMPVGHDKEENLRCAAESIAFAARQQADIAILPEMWNCPYSNAYFAEYAEAAGGAAWRGLSAAARDNGIYVVGGSIPERDGERVYNTSFVFDRKGAQLARHRKMHLFDIDIAGGQRFFESETFWPGEEVTVFSTEFCTIGLCICFDFRFPELSRLMSLGGAEIIIVPAAFNMTTGPAHWETMFRQRAVDDQVFTVGVAPARDEQGVYVSYANSIVCSPWGHVICRGDAEAEIFLVDIDLKDVGKVRRQLPLLSARRRDVYTLRVE